MSSYNIVAIRGGYTLGREGHLPSQIHLLPPSQIQKLADCSDVISEVPKCSKISIFRGSTSDHAGGAYSTPPNPLTDEEGAR